MTRKSIKFSFDNGRGEILAGVLDLPAESPAHHAVFAPCFTCTKESHGAYKVSRALAARNIATLRFDMTGLGDSEGVFMETNFTTRIADIVAACHAVEEKYGPPDILVGHSISGTAALYAAQKIPSARLLATVGSPRDPEYIIDKFKKNRQIVFKGEVAELTIAGRQIEVKKSFVDDMLSYPRAEKTSESLKKLLVFHAPQDNIVSFENAREIYDRAVCAKELIPLRQAATHLLDHGMEDAFFIADEIAKNIT